MIFSERKNVLLHKEGTKFPIHVHQKMTVMITVKKSLDLQSYHEILGHCNYADIKKLRNVVDGMDIKEEGKNPIPFGEVCPQGKFVQTRNRGPDIRANAPLDMVHTDLAGPIDPMSHSEHRYALSFTDDYFSAVCLFFEK